MAMRIEPYTADYIPAVKSLNSRLTLSNVHGGFRLPDSAPESAPRDAPVYKEHYLAVENEEVRGAFVLQQQDFWVNGRALQVGNYQMPISEGIINTMHASLGMAMLRHALRIQPYLFCLGMGGRQHRLPRMLARMGWSFVDIPFLFRVHHPARVLRNIVPLRSSRGRRVLMDLLAVSGGGWLGLRIMQARPTAARGIGIQPVNGFDCWADVLWHRCKTVLSFGAIRLRTALNLLYPATGGRFLTLKMTRGSDDVGWVVLRDTQMRNHRYFGNLRVGTIIDGMAVPEEVPAVVGAATNLLEQRGVDLTISNQGHRAWVEGLRGCGFLRGPTNFILAMSPRLTALLEPLETHRARLHITRGDGDGPLDL